MIHTVPPSMRQTLIAFHYRILKFLGRNSNITPDRWKRSNL